MRLGLMAGQWGWSFSDLRTAWREAEGCGFEVLGCFDHATAAPEGLTAWDAPSLLTAMAGETRTSSLALWVANAALRHPLRLASQIAVAQECSEGRVELGLGAGSQSLARFDHLAMDVPFPPLPERLRRLELMCDALPRLWAGESVTEPALGLRDACLGPFRLDVPPLLVGGRSTRALEIAAAKATFWNAEQGSADDYAALSVRAAEAAEQVGRTKPFPGTAQLFTDDRAPTEIGDEAARFRAAGAHTVMLVMDRPEPGRIAKLAEACRVGR